MPKVSVVIATYGRSQVLATALRSLSAQDFTDFEALVIGDACNDDTAEVVTAIGDERFTFNNLPVNYGEQSGPNNLGISLARGRHVAFLNQDDLWFRDHLSTAVAWIEATDADLVNALSIGIWHSSAEALEAGAFSTFLDGIGRNGRYDPVRTFASASTLLVRTEVFHKIGRFRPAAECHSESSQDFLFRAWRAGLAHRTVPVPTVITLSSGGRPGSYRDRLSPEHDKILERLDQREFRALLLDRLAAPLPSTGKNLARIVWDSARRAIARAGVSPRDLRYRFSRGFGKGGYIDHLRAIRGLPRKLWNDDSIESLREGEIARGTPLAVAEMIDFTLNGNAHRVKLSGWTSAKQEGTWARGPRAMLAFKLQAGAADQDLELAIDGEVSLRKDHPGQRIEFSANGAPVAKLEFRLGEPQQPIVVPLPRQTLSEGLIRIELSFSDVTHPMSIGWPRDVRRRRLLMHSMQVRAQRPSTAVLDRRTPPTRG